MEEELIEPHRTIRLTLHPCEPAEPVLGMEGAVVVRLEMEEAERVYRSLARFFKGAEG